MNATDAQVLNLTRSAPPPTSSTAPSSSTMESHNGLVPTADAQNQMIQKFSQQSGMTLEYSKLFVSPFFYESILIVCFV